MALSSEVVSFTVTVPSTSIVHMSTFGGGPGNLDFSKFADHVPAKPPAGMPAAFAANEAARRESADNRRCLFIVDMILLLNRTSILFSQNSGQLRLSSTEDRSKMKARVGNVLSN